MLIQQYCLKKYIYIFKLTMSVALSNLSNSHCFSQCLMFYLPASDFRTISISFSLPSANSNCFIGLFWEWTVNLRNNMVSSSHENVKLVNFCYTQTRTDSTHTKEQADTNTHRDTLTCRHTYRHTLLKSSVSQIKWRHESILKQSIKERSAARYSCTC